MSEPFDGVRRGLAVECRKQVNDAFVRAYQFVIFEGYALKRSITTENPRKHWKIESIAGVEKYVEQQMTALQSQGYELTTEPFLVEATASEWSEQITKLITPRNVTLRVERVRTERGLPSAVEPAAV